MVFGNFGPLKVTHYFRDFWKKSNKFYQYFSLQAVCLRSFVEGLGCYYMHFIVYPHAPSPKNFGGWKFPMSQNLFYRL